MMSKLLTDLKDEIARGNYPFTPRFTAVDAATRIFLLVKSRRPHAVYEAADIAFEIAVHDRSPIVLLIVFMITKEHEMETFFTGRLGGPLHSKRVVSALIENDASDLMRSILLQVPVHWTSSPESLGLSIDNETSKLYRAYWNMTGH